MIKFLLPVIAALCSQVSHGAPEVLPLSPLSDSKNAGGWIYNSEVSDEFNTDTINEGRWYIVGKFEDGKPVFKHPDQPRKKVWKGRAPSQFSGRNYRLEDGKLKLKTRWEPDFPFGRSARVLNSIFSSFMEGIEPLRG